MTDLPDPLRTPAPMLSPQPILSPQPMLSPQPTPAPAAMWAADCSAMLAGLYHYLDGELTEDRRLHIQSHLDSCPSCFGAFDFEAELRIVVRSRVMLRVPEALVQKIRLAISGESLTIRDEPQE